ncbi:interferon-inducible GTPase 1-like, partial [Paramacrobiotus metropolitanus]|uniref:interferon-inducible GTPase 1-like n=1 Tax=Paramacrobiotus metropolitanus TaxID=2943436 RepID=UPI002445CB80
NESNFGKLVFAYEYKHGGRRKFANIGSGQFLSRRREGNRGSIPGGWSRVGFARILQERNDRWKTVPLNIAVIGQSGVGKSSYINCSRNITAEDEGGAQVNIVECTAEVRPYAHPDNPLLVYWDCPGVGTPKFPRETYLENIDFQRYDFYLLLSSSRFTYDDQWLATEIGRLGKRFFYVRTQSGVDVDKQRKSHPRTTASQSDDEILQKVRDDIIKKLELFKVEEGTSSSSTVTNPASLTSGSCKTRC